MSVRHSGLHPTLDIFVRALPFTYRDVEAAVGRSLRFEVLGDAGGAGPWVGFGMGGGCSWARMKLRPPG